MNHVDFILAIPLAIGAIRGFSRGFILEAASLIGLVAGVFVAALFADITGKVILEMMDWNPMAVKILAFVISFVLVIVAVHIVARFIEKIFKVTGLNIFNRVAGVAAGALKIAFVLSVFLIFFNHLNRNNFLMSDETRDGSFLYNKVAAFVPSILPSRDFIVVKDTVDRIRHMGEE